MGLPVGSLSAFVVGRGFVPKFGRWYFCCYFQNKKWVNMLFSTITCRIKVPYPFQWGGPTFNAGDVFAMMAASFASLIEVCIS